jgi:hypothetical protein
MSDRSVLGGADVDDAELVAMVAAQLGEDSVTLESSSAVVADYDLDTLTTAGRYWVDGIARTPSGATAPFRFFVKVVQSWERSPVFQQVPEEMRAEALAMIPWRREPQIYATDLGDRLPAGLSMPAARHVRDVDDLSAALWLDAVDTRAVTWDLARFGTAARLLGRLAASAEVAPIGELGSIGNVQRRYAAGRFAGQVLPALNDDGLWQHPLLAHCFGDRLRDDMRAAAAAMPGYLDELDTVPVGTCHGDACTRNLLVREGAGDDEFVLIDFGFWSRAPLGFDLSQLLIGEVQTGERAAADLPAIEAACVPAYTAGLAAEGCDVTEDVVARSHALFLLLFAGLSAIPFELLAGPVDDESVRVARERAGGARFSLDLVAGTTPLL